MEAIIGSMRGVILDSNHNNGQVEERNRCSPSQIKEELPTKTQQILPHSWDGSLHQTLPDAVDQVFVLVERMRNCDQWCQSACLGDNGQHALWFLWSVEAMASLVMGVCCRNNLFLGTCERLLLAKSSPNHSSCSCLSNLSCVFLWPSPRLLLVTQMKWKDLSQMTCFSLWKD